MTRTSRLLFAVFLLAHASCIRQDPHPRFSPAWEEVDLTQPGWETTRASLVVADCQIHNIYSQPVPERNLSIETAVGTAIRPPQLDLFSADVLSWILENGAPDAELVLHLGDALNVACEGEFDSFLDVMSAGKKPWYMAPGNHDAYYMGNFDPQRTELWDAGCHGSGPRVTKDRFVQLYVTALIEESKDPNCQQFGVSCGYNPNAKLDRDTRMQSLPLEFEWEAPKEAKGFLRRIAWKIDLEQPWRSFVLQEIDVSGSDYPVHVIILDSSQYARRPTLLPNAWASYPVALNCGMTGELLPNQLRTLRSWVEANSVTDTGVVFAAHHPYESIAARSRSAIGWLWREHSVAVMLTAHTHKGFFAHHDLGGDGDEIEINIGSTTDWPMEWRVLQGYVNREDQKLYIRAKRGLLADALRKTGGYFKVGWELPLDAPDDYRQYKQGESANGLMASFFLAYHWTPYWIKQPRVRANRSAQHTEKQVKNTLLWTYYRLTKTFPSATGDSKTRWPEDVASDDQLLGKIVEVATGEFSLEEKVLFLKQLARFERTRRSVDPVSSVSTDADRARFKLSQAAWASRFEAAEGRRLNVEDEMIRFDWDKTRKSSTR